MKMHYDIVKKVAKMKPIVKVVRSRFSDPDPRLWAQQSLGPVSFAAMAPGSPPAADAVDAGLMPVVAVVALLVLIVWSAVKFYDRSRKREEEAVALQARISDALMVEPSLSALPLTPTVRMPLSRRGPVMIELSGSVPRPALRQAAIDVVLREVESTGRGCALQDRIAVTSARLGRAA